MLFRTRIGFCLVVMLLQVLIACSNSNLGNGVFVQHLDEAIDVGSPFGSCIFVGTRKDGYTTYDEILIHSEIISHYQTDNFVYVKQKFDVEGFKTLISGELKHLDLNKSYIPDEIYELLKKNSTYKGSIDIIDSSNYIKDRINNGLYNYYIVNTRDYSVKIFFKESDFLHYLNKNNLSNIFKEL